MNKFQKLFLDISYGYILGIIIFDSLIVASVVFWIRNEFIISIIFSCCFLFLLFKTFFTIYSIKQFFINIKRRIWNKHILTRWYNYKEIPENEFDISLSLDPFAMMVMNIKELQKYHKDIARRRQIAHERDLKRYDS